LRLIHFGFDQAILVSSSLLLTARIVEGTPTHVFPLSGTASTKLPPGIPSLRQAQKSGTIKLKEIHPPGALARQGSTTKKDGIQRDWLTLTLRETLG
jgi:AAA family ATPase